MSESKKNPLLIEIMDKIFDLFFLILSIICIVFWIYEISKFLISLFHLIIENKPVLLATFFQTGLEILILVKFYKILKDYIGNHHIKLRNLAEIWIVSLLSKLIFQLESYSLNEIIIKIILLITIVILFYLEVYREDKKVCQED